MGVFDNIINRQEKTKAEKLLDYFKSHPEIENRDGFVEILTPVVRQETVDQYMNSDIFCTILAEASELEYLPYNVKKTSELYNLIVYDDKNPEQVGLFHKFANLFLYATDHSFGWFYDFETLYNLFNNKRLVLHLCDYFVKHDIEKTHISRIIKYIKEARRYYIDEEAFFGTIMGMVKTIDDKCIVSDWQVSELIEETLVEDKNSAGIYDIDEEKVLDLAEKVQNMKTQIKKIDKLSLRLNDYFLKLEENTTKTVNEIISEKTNEVVSLQKKVLEEIKDFITKATAVSDNSIKEIEKKGDFYLEKINELLDISPDDKESLKDNLNETLTKETRPSILSNDFSLHEKRKIIRDKMMTSGEKYHEVFERILKFVLLGKPVMLVGPSGSGKTYTVEQIAQLLDLPLYNFGFIADEYASIKGYNDANGNFVKTPFYDCLKYGGICFYDEADNSEAKAFMEINKIVGASGYNPYLFPNGETVIPHPNFRIIAASNTWGDGADTIHSTREKLDGATLNRFERIYYGYDSDLERSIMQDYPDVYDFAIAYRKSITNRNIDKIISTRDLSDIKDYLDSEEFALEDVIESKFINGLRKDTLIGILSDINDDIGDFVNSTLNYFENIVNGGKVKVK